MLDGKARYRGVEFSVQGDLTRDVSFIGSATYIDARQIDSSDPTLLGKTPQNTPHVTTSLFAQYRVPLVAGLSINAGMYYIGPRPVNSADQAYIGGYSLYTAGASYDAHLWKTRVVSGQPRERDEQALLERYGFESDWRRAVTHA